MPWTQFLKGRLALEKHFVLSLLYLRVIPHHYFVSLNYMFLDKKTVLKIWLNLGLNLIIFQGTGHRGVCGKQPLFLRST